MTLDSKAAAAAIEALRNRRIERLLDGDMVGMVDGFYATDARLLPPDRPTIEGIEAIRVFWRAAPEEGLISLELRRARVEGSGELVYETGTFRRTLRPRHGHPFNDVGKYMVVYRRQADGEYRAEAEMFNSPRGR